MTSADIQTLAREKRFGEVENAVYADRKLIGQLVDLLGSEAAPELVAIIIDPAFREADRAPRRCLDSVSEM